MDQFVWLQNELKNSRSSSEKVWIIGHIAPGADVKFSTTWHKRYVRSFIAILSEYNDVIVMNFFAHLHRDDFRLVYNQNSGIYCFLQIPKW